MTTTTDQQNAATGLLPSVSIANLCNQRAAVIDRLTQAHALLIEADEIASNAKLGDVARLFEQERFCSHGNLGGFLEADAVAKYMRVLDGEGWHYLLNESGLRSFMDKTARTQWLDAVYKNKAPELTPENIAATFRGLHEDRALMVERGVVALFRRLSWHYKTNTPVKFGKRIIMRSFLYAGGYITHETTNELMDLTRAFCIMDGKPEPDHRDPSGIERTIQASRDNTAENEYLSIRWYVGTKTGHIIFKRPDLVDKLNDVIAKAHPDALPAAR